MFNCSAAIRELVAADVLDSGLYNAPEHITAADIAPYFDEYKTDRANEGTPVPDDLTVEAYVAVWNEETDAWHARNDRKPATSPEHKRKAMDPQTAIEKLSDLEAFFAQEKNRATGANYAELMDIWFCVHSALDNYRNLTERRI